MKQLFRNSDLNSKTYPGADADTDHNKTYPGADAETDHNLVATRIMVKLKIVYKGRSKNTGIQIFFEKI